MDVTVMFLGPARDAAGRESTTLTLPDGVTLADACTRLFEAFPGLASGRSVLRFAVNRAFAEQDQRLADGDELAVIPPVSGGDSTPAHVALTNQPLDLEAVRATVMGDPANGAVVTFEGTTRRETHPEHGALTRLEYEAYGAMALEQMRRLVADAQERWSLGAVALVHRQGVVALGESSVIIAVAAGHRAEAFEACRWLIDTLKQEVPIWKREVWADGTTTWVDPTRTTGPVPPP